MFETLLEGFKDFFQKITGLMEWRTSKDSADESRDQAIQDISQSLDEFRQSMANMGMTFQEFGAVVRDLTERVQDLENSGGGGSGGSSDPVLSVASVGSEIVGENAKFRVMLAGSAVDEVYLTINGTVYAGLTPVDPVNGSDFEWLFEGYTNTEEVTDVIATVVLLSGATVESNTLIYTPGVDTTGSDNKVEIVSKGSRTEGTQAFLEAVVTLDGVEISSTNSLISTVEFFVGTSPADAVLNKTEKVWRYEATPVVPSNPQMYVQAVVKTADGREFESSTYIDVIADSSGGGTGGGSGSGSGSGSGGSTDVGIIGDFDVVVYHNDEFTNDNDSNVAFGVAAAIARSSEINNMVFFCGNNLAEVPTPWQYEVFQETRKMVEGFGYEVWDYRADGDVPLDDNKALAELVRLYSSGQKIVVLEGGPMIASYEALTRTPAQFHSNITLVSHSSWNESRDNSGLNRKWAPLKAAFPGVNTIDISDQNTYFNSNDWNWLDSYNSGILNDIRQRMIAGEGTEAGGKRNDASDAGMLAFIITGNEAVRVSWVQDLWLSNPPSRVGEVPEFANPEEGVFVLNAGDMDIVDTLWNRVPSSDAVGGAYIEWTGDEHLSAINPDSVLAGKVVIGEGQQGVYQFIARSFSNHPDRPDQWNDQWVTFRQPAVLYAEKNGAKVYPRGNASGLTPTNSTNDGVEGFFKYYQNVNQAWTFETEAIDNNPHLIYVNFPEPGEYTFELAARSIEHFQDLFILKHSDLPLSVLDKYSEPASTGGGSGGTGGGGTGGSGGGSSVIVGIDMVDELSAQATGEFYNFNAEDWPVGIKGTGHLQEMFNSTSAFYGNPANRVAIEELPGIGKALAIGSDGSSANYYNRLTSHNRNNAQPYAPGKVVVSHLQMYFGRDMHTARKHAKGCGISALGVPQSCQNSKTDAIRSIDPGDVEVVRLSYYNAASQVGKSLNNKGDVGAAYHGKNTVWKAETLPLIESKGFFLVAPAIYTQNPNMPYECQNMFYIEEPDENNMPSGIRMLLPTDKIIDQWLVWKGNTTQEINGEIVGNYDGSLYQFYRIEGYNNDEPWCAGILENHLWVHGAPFAARRAGVGIYYNSSDAPDGPTKFHILKDHIVTL